LAREQADAGGDVLPRVRQTAQARKLTCLPCLSSSGLSWWLTRLDDVMGPPGGGHGTKALTPPVLDRLPVSYQPVGIAAAQEREKERERERKKALRFLNVTRPKPKFTSGGSPSQRLTPGGSPWQERSSAALSSPTAGVIVLCFSISLSNTALQERSYQKTCKW
jgi:hypothetical protein